MNYTDEETRPVTLLQNWHETYRLPVVTSEEAKSMVYLRISEVKKGERVSRWKLGGIAEYGNDALMETFRDSMTVTREEVEGGTPRSDLTDVLGILIVSHGAGRWGTSDPETGEPCVFGDLSEEYQKQVIQGVSDEQLEALRMDIVPCRVVNIISLSGLLGEITLFSPTSEPRVEIIEQWEGDTDSDDIVPTGPIDEALMKTLMLLQLLNDIAREGHEMTPDGMMDYAMSLVRRGDESANVVMSVVLKMITSALDAGGLDLTKSEDDD